MISIFLLCKFGQRPESDDTPKKAIDPKQHGSEKRPKRLNRKYVLKERTTKKPEATLNSKFSKTKQERARKSKEEQERERTRKSKKEKERTRKNKKEQERTRKSKKEQERARKSKSRKKKANENQKAT